MVPPCTNYQVMVVAEDQEAVEYARGIIFSKVMMIIILPWTQNICNSWYCCCTCSHYSSLDCNRELKYLVLRDHEFQRRISLVLNSSFQGTVMTTSVHTSMKEYLWWKSMVVPVYFYYNLVQLFHNPIIYSPKHDYVQHPSGKSAIMEKCINRVGYTRKKECYLTLASDRHPDKEVLIIQSLSCMTTFTWSGSGNGRQKIYCIAVYTN